MILSTGIRMAVTDRMVENLVNKYRGGELVPLSPTMEVAAMASDVITDANTLPESVELMTQGMDYHGPAAAIVHCCKQYNNKISITIILMKERGIYATDTSTEGTSGGDAGRY